MADVHIALLMMVKNENKRLHVSLESVLGYVDSVVLYDTGSEDDTIQIAKNFCEKHNIIFRLKEGEFKNFAESRNVSLDFADTFPDIDYLLLLDTNDELREGSKLREFCKKYKDEPNTGFLLCQEWWSGQYDKYYNVRLVKARKGWRYRGRVHEWMKNTRFENDEEAQKAGDCIIRLPSDIILYQDRTQDDNKTGKRFARDKILLLEDHKDNPSEPRTVFYLAQTCACLSDMEDAFYYYKLRTTLEGFWEERFHAFQRCGELSEEFKHPWEESMKWYIKAFEHTARAEPLIKIAEHYKDKNWLLSFTFSQLVCKLSYPDHCILFVDKYAYDYKRWHMLGISGWYSGFHKEGKIGCMKAIESGLNTELEKNNLKHYEDYEKNNAEQQKSEQDQEIISKKEFMNITMQQLVKEHPGISHKQLSSKAKRMWKNRELDFCK
jgi:glycosyltransferase involved in cell wall biosynthesis